jgi:multiple sugar transport system substrate-binding protein
MTGMKNYRPHSGGPVSRRFLLKSGLALGGAMAVAPILSACGGEATPSASTSGSAEAPTTSGGGTVTFGGNTNEQEFIDATGRVFEMFTQSSGIEVKPTYTDNQTWQTNMNRYLQGNPDDAILWACGYRMRYFAGKGLLTPLDDVWTEIGSNYNEGFTELAKGDDGHPYIVPIYNTPWGMFYRKSLWEERGYTIPETADQMRELCKQMKADGLIPLGFCNKDGWEAMGFFDYCNFRTNGYDFHMRLLNNEEAWDSAEVKATLDSINSFREFWQPNFAGRTWQESGAALGKKEVGMILFGSFIGQAFEAEDLADLDFFMFPEINPEYGRDTIDSPGDGIMLTKAPKDLEAAKKFAAYWGYPEVQSTYVETDSTAVADGEGVDISKYTDLQKTMSQMASTVKHVAQFADRDSRPDFVSTILVPAYQQWLANPGDADSILKQIDSQRKALFETEE